MKDKVENHPAVFFLTTFISGIGIGFAAHTAMTVERSAALDALKTSLEAKEEHLKESLENASKITLISRKSLTNLHPSNIQRLHYCLRLHR